MRKVRRLKTCLLQSQHGAKGRNKVLKSRVLKAWKSTTQWTELKAANRAGEGRKATGFYDQTLAVDLWKNNLGPMDTVV